MAANERDAAADDGEERGERVDAADKGSASEPSLPPDVPAPYRIGWRERVLGWLFAVFLIVFVVWRLLPALLIALFSLVARTLVYLALFGRRDRDHPARPESDEANTVLLDSYADLDTAGTDRGVGAVLAGWLGGLSGGAAFCGAVALVYYLLDAPVLWNGLYVLWLLFVAFPLGATLGSVMGRAARRWQQGEGAPARDIAERGGTGIAVGMMVAVPVAVAYVLIACGGDPECAWWYLSAELPIYLLALLWGLALRCWSMREGSEQPR